MLRLLARLRDLDRRWIFLGVWILVMVPLIWPFALPLAVTPPVRQYHATIESLPEGSLVLLSADFDPASAPELVPMLRASLAHLAARKARIVVDCLWPGGPPLVETALKDVLEREQGYRYGEDYVFLGFKEGRETVMLSMGNSIPATFPVDYRGTPVAELALMKRVKNLEGMALLVNISAGYPGTKEWVQQTQSRFQLRMVSGCTAVSAPEYYTYLQSKQLLGLLGGMAGAAEYEKLVDIAGPATKGMDAQSSVHLLIMFLILLGNLSQWAARRLGQR